MWQPRFGISWNPGGDGTKVLRANAGIFYGRIPGLALASSRSTNGSRGQTIFRSSAVNFDGCLPVYPNKLSAACVGAPDHPDVFVFDEDFENPRTHVGVAVVGAGADSGLRVPGEVQLRQGRAHHALRQRQRSAAHRTARRRAARSPAVRGATASARAAGTASAR